MNHAGVRTAIPVCAVIPVRAVIPMKPLALCKERLATVVRSRRRAALVLWMLERVVRAALGAASVTEVVVLGGDEPVQELCRTAGCNWQADPAGDLNVALDAFSRETRASDWGALLFLAGDLPLLESSDVDQMVQRLGSVDLVLAAGARGGTNAILSRCGIDFRFQLGEQSLRKHLAQAGGLGITPFSYESPQTYTDLDTPEDLKRLLLVEPDLWQQVERLERLLPQIAS